MHEKTFLKERLEQIMEAVIRIEELGSDQTLENIGLWIMDYGLSSNPHSFPLPTIHCSLPLYAFSLIL